MKIFRLLFLMAIILMMSVNAVFGQAATVNFTQQTGNFTTWGDGGGSWNQSATQMGMWANTGNKQTVAWRTFKTADNGGGSARALKVGDKFTLSISATRAYGQIGFALLSSPATGSWVNRESNYSLTVKLDGPLYGSWGNWYATGAGTSAASFGGNQGTYKDFVFTVTLTAPDRANISITDGTSTSNFYDFQLKNSNAITDFSVFLQDNWDGGANNNMYVGIGSGSNCSVQSTGALSVGVSSGSFSIGGVIPNGVYADQTVTSYTNALTKSGTGEVTLGAVNTYTGTTTISAGTLTLGIANAIPANAMTLNGTLKTGATSGYGTTIGTLTMGSTSTIALGSGSHTLTFGDSHLLTWTGTLNITGWLGTATSSGGGTAGLIFFGSANTTLSSTQLSNITFSGFPAGAALKSNGELVPASAASYTTAGAGDWSTGATWTGSSVPPAGAITIIAHAVTVNSSVTNAPTSITVNSGSSLTFGGSGAITTTTLTNNGSVIMTAGGTLTIAASGTFANNNTFTRGTGTVSFTNAGTINGSAVTTFNNLTLNLGALTLTTVPHIAGIFQINNGNVTASPIYDASSTLKYNVGYNRYLEWNAVGAGTVGTTAGYPYNVLVATGPFDLSNGDITSARACAGSLTVNSGATLNMSATAGALTVGGDLTINGTLSLSSTTGGDIKASGNISFGATSTFNGNGRAIFFIKDGTQTLTHGSGAITIPYLVIGKSGGTGTTIQMSGTDITSSAPLGGNSISFTNSTDVLDLNGKNLTIGTALQASTITGPGTIKGNSSSSITILGTGAYGSLAFTSGSQLLSGLTINRTSSGSVSLGTNLTISGTLALTSGTMTLGANNLTLGSSASVTGASTSNFIVTDAAGVVTRAVPATNTDVLFPVGPSSSSYNPAIINNNGGTADNYSVKVANSTANTLTPANQIVNKQWTINESVDGGSNAVITLQWNTGDQVGSFTQSGCVIGKYTGTGTIWTEYATTAVSSTNPFTSKTSAITGTGVFQNSVYSLGNKGALPVELTSFNAKVTGKTTQLSWTTATELNNYGFEIQRSKKSSESFEKVGFVNGAGNSNSPKSYSFSDKNLANGNYIYRLKQIDLGGEYKYSNEVEVIVNSTPKQYTLEQNYPNPFNPSTRINFSIMNPGLVTVNIYNAIGQVVKTISKTYSEAGSYSVDFNGTTMPSGIYFYKLQSGSFSQIRKMMLVK